MLKTIKQKNTNLLYSFIQYVGNNKIEIKQILKEKGFTCYTKEKHFYIQYLPDFGFDVEIEPFDFILIDSYGTVSIANEDLFAHTFM